LDDRVVQRLRLLRCGRLAPVVEAARLHRSLNAAEVDVVHAWSLAAAQTAVLARGTARRPPVVMTCWDPYLSQRDARWVALLERTGQVTVLCHAQHVQRRWLEHGLTAARSAVVRPGVDFGQLNRHRRDPAVASALGLKRGQRVVLLPPSASPRGGHLFGLWVATAAQYLHPELRLLIPGSSPEADRVRRRAQRLPNAACVHMTGEDFGYETLLNWADAVLVPASEDISTTPLAWAMAAGVPIVACATYATSELLASGVNSLLVKPGEPMVMARKLLSALGEDREARRLGEVARGQAFEAFSMTRYVEQVRKAWDDLAAGRPVGEAAAQRPAAPAAV
jgi:glycosyltransferase involved in cell wall biosynthesis